LALGVEYHNNENVHNITIMSMCMDIPSQYNDKYVPKLKLTNKAYVSEVSYWV